MPRTEREPILPLIKTEWNQEAPYNDLCPKVDGHETVTGCVATAMAQAMKYYNYPEKGTGVHSYLWRPGEEELSFNYDATPFLWNEMTDRYDSHSSAEARHAVAELMLACGISVNMHYEPGESGAATSAMGSALIDIFGYAPSLWMPDRVFYGYYEWEEMIYNELAQGHPVLYSGAGTAGGHQFICDGYQADGYFHFNWGWGGLSNGYFLLNALNPDDLGVGGGAGGFNTSQVATIGMTPAKGNEEKVYIFCNTEAFSTDASSVKADEDFRCNGLYFNYSLFTMPEGSRLGLKFKEQNIGDERFAEGPSVARFHNGDGRNDLQVRFPNLPDGTYIITPALKVDDKWSDVRMPVGYPAEITAEVLNSVATLHNTSAAEIEVTDVVLPSVIYRDKEFPMTFVVKNADSEEYYGNVTPVLLNSSGVEVSKSKFRPVDVMGEDKEIVNDYEGLFSNLPNQELPAGSYSLVFKDGNGRTVSEPLEVKLEIMTEETRFSVTDFKLDNENPVTTPESVKFSYTLTCNAGIFYSNLVLRIFPGDGGDEVYAKNSQKAYLTPGEKQSVTIVADLSRLEERDYIAMIYDGGKPLTDELRFRLKIVSTGLETTPIFQNADQQFYDLSGVGHSRPVTGKINILNGKKVLIIK